VELWRAFPWDPASGSGERFSPQYVNPIQVDGRFDLGCKPCVLYAAGTREQALAEKLQRYRGRRIGSEHLKEWGRAIAVVDIVLPDELVRGLTDLGDPATLLRLGVRPDRLMSWERKATQAIARLVHEAGAPGLQCWSSLRGDWTSTILFLNRVPVAQMRFGAPEIVHLTSALLDRVAVTLGLDVARGRT